MNETSEQEDKDPKESRQLTRREFLKMAALGTVTLSVGGLIAEHKTATIPEILKIIYLPGTEKIPYQLNKNELNRFFREQLVGQRGKVHILISPRIWTESREAIGSEVNVFPAKTEKNFYYANITFGLKEYHPDNRPEDRDFSVISKLSGKDNLNWIALHELGHFACLYKDGKIDELTADKFANQYHLNYKIIEQKR